MPALLLRGFTIVALALTFGVSHPPSAKAQTIAGSRPLALPVEPITPTRIETLLATPNLMLVADYYRIDMRFGPALRIDALVVEVVDRGTRVKGLRVQVRDPESRGRQQGESFIDVDELPALSRALSSMSELSGRWTHDDRQATEMAFTTSGGFRIAIRQSARIPRTYLSTGLLDPVITSIDLAELPTIRHAFDQAIALLNSK